MSDLPSNWLNVALGDLATITSGIGFPISYQGETTGDIAFFKVGDISRDVAKHGGLLGADNAQHFVSGKVAVELKGKTISSGSTVFAKIGEAIKLNRRAFVTDECLVDNNVVAVKAIFDASDQYFYRFIQTQDLTDLSRATTVPSLRKGDIESLVVPLAPLHEQKRIADKLDTLLSRVDACRERLDRVPATLKRFRQSILAAACSGQLTADWREVNDRVSVSASLFNRATPRTGSSDLPESWLACTVGDVMNLKNGYAFKSTDYVAAGIPLVRISNIQDGRVTLDNCVSLPEAKANWDFVVDPGDILVAMSGATTGKFGVYSGSERCLQNQRVGNLRILYDGEVCTGYRNIYLQSLRKQIEDAAYGGAQPNISPAKIGALPFNCPPVPEQHEIVRRVEQLFAFAEALEARVATAQAQVNRLTPSLLRKAFRGELVPQDPNDEPATELLKRIQTTRAAEPKRGKSSKRRTK